MMRSYGSSNAFVLQNFGDQPTNCSYPLTLSSPCKLSSYILAFRSYPLIPVPTSCCKTRYG